MAPSRGPDGQRELLVALSDMPEPPQYGGQPVTNTRNVSNPHWRGSDASGNRTVTSCPRRPSANTRTPSRVRCSFGSPWPITGRCSPSWAYGLNGCRDAPSRISVPGRRLHSSPRPRRARPLPFACLALVCGRPRAPTPSRPDGLRRYVRRGSPASGCRCARDP